jgi:hypothetical protein
MDNERKYRFVLPSVGDILFMSVFLYLSFSAGKGLLADCDTGYHIRAGEYMLTTLSVPKHDIFSFTTPPIPWTAHEWLSEVIMALIHKGSGLTGIVIFFSFVIAATYYLLFRLLRTYNGNILVAAAIATLVIASSQIHWLARPHVFSLLLTVVWYGLLDRYQRTGNKRDLYFLPLVVLLWVNLHGGFIIAFVLIVIYLSGNFFKFVTSAGEEKKEFRRKTWSLAMITSFCLLASLVNPIGYHILLFPFTLASNKFIMDNVSEFISPNFHDPMVFTYLLLLMIAVFALSGKGLNVVELMLIILFTYMALYSARYIPLFGIICAPILTTRADGLLKGSRGRLAEFFKRRSERIVAVDSAAGGYLWPAIAVVVVVVSASSGKIAYSFEETVKPVAAVEFLKREHLRGNMFNNDEFGDYIIYAAWPEYRVFFDGRSDMYGVERMKDYFKVSRVESGWQDVLKKYRMNWIIYNADSPLCRFLLADKEWRLIYADKVANIFVRNIPEYRVLIERYSGVEPVAGQKKEM